MLRVAFLAAALLAAVPATPALAQCSMCKENLKENEAQPLANGFRWSIYGMIAMPFLLTGGILVMIVRSDRRAARRGNPGQPTVS
ncbi:MAG: hypothetical protein HYY18_03235 [Planctomycetes bacterium]|nr:hypothetical protein [Planctomycetota bacterium]